MFASYKTVKGFTLLEVIIAVAIFAVLSLASFNIFNMVLKSDDFSQEKSSRINELQKAFLIIERDITQITQRGMRKEGEVAGEAFLHTEESNLISEEQALSFVRNGWVNPGYLIPRSDVQAVAYQLKEGVLERLHFNFVDAVVGQEPKVRALLTGVIELNFEYFDGKKWQETFSPKNLPLAIAMEVELEDYGLIRRQFLVAGKASVVSDN